MADALAHGIGLGVGPDQPFALDGVLDHVGFRMGVGLGRDLAGEGVQAAGHIARIEEDLGFPAEP